MEENGHVLQSENWVRFQEALGRAPVLLEGDGWRCQGFVVNSRGVRYLYCPRGPALTASGKLADVAAEWNQLDQKLDFVRFEPMGEASEPELKAIGAHRVADFQPARTLVLDLSQTEEELRHEVVSGHRNAINGFERRGLTFRVSSNPEDGAAFLKMLDETSKRTGFKAFSHQYLVAQFRTLMPLGALKLYFAEHEGKPVAGAVALDGETVRCYAHAAALPEARKLQAAAPLVWRMMMDAKAEGKTRFDLWGVSPVDATDHPWHGLSSFKRGFGGKEVEYVGTWELPMSRMKYQLYQTAKRFMGR
jgi:lipid II:glycine glycyltransferase (peptidoglycan interpeptide bridge formation enzyme)